MFLVAARSRSVLPPAAAHPRYCAGQLFSPDGSSKSWRFHSQDHAPYGFASGSMVLSTRERPTLVQDAVTGRPVALINGVSPLAPTGERNVRMSQV